jgi:hypothetical protein
MKLRPTIKLLLWLIAAVVLLHLAILIKLIPYEVTWGGRLKNDSEMYVFESTSILANLLLGCVLLIKGGYLSTPIPPRAVNVILWIFLALFGLNTLGNLFAETLFEQSLSLVTLGFSFLIWRVLKTKGKTTRSKIY